MLINIYCDFQGHHWHLMLLVLSLFDYEIFLKTDLETLLFLGTHFGKE